MRGLLLALVLVVIASQPASAHRLKVFATVEDGVIGGYAFFIGGGRPQGATIVIRDAAGREAYRGVTDSEGAFSWHPPQPANFTVQVDARDGHVAEAHIGADHFAGADAAITGAPAVVAANVAPAADDGDADSAELAAAIDRSVDRAVARQIRPLLEAYAEAEGRVRFNDIAGGIGMIVGLAGIAMWAASRRRPAPPAKDS